MLDRDQVSGTADRLVASPSFELTCAYDDSDDPSEVTVFPEDADDITTTWLTADVDHAIDLPDTV